MSHNFDEGEWSSFRVAMAQFGRLKATQLDPRYLDIAMLRPLGDRDRILEFIERKLDTLYELQREIPQLIPIHVADSKSDLLLPETWEGTEAFRDIEEAARTSLLSAALQIERHCAPDVDAQGEATISTAMQKRLDQKEALNTESKFQRANDIVSDGIEAGILINSYLEASENYDGPSPVDDVSAVLGTIGNIAVAVGGLILAFFGNNPIGAAIGLIVTILGYLCKAVSAILEYFRGRFHNYWSGTPTDWSYTEVKFIVWEKLRLLALCEEEALTNEVLDEYFEAYPPKDTRLDVLTSMNNQMNRVDDARGHQEPTNIDSIRGSAIAICEAFSSFSTHKSGTKSMQIINHITSVLTYAGLDGAEVNAVWWWLYEARKVTQAEIRYKNARSCGGTGTDCRGRSAGLTSHRWGSKAWFEDSRGNPDYVHFTLGDLTYVEASVTRMLVSRGAIDPNRVVAKSLRIVPGIHFSTTDSDQEIQTGFEGVLVGFTGARALILVGGFYCLIGENLRTDQVSQEFRFTNYTFFEKDGYFVGGVAFRYDVTRREAVTEAAVVAEIPRRVRLLREPLSPEDQGVIRAQHFTDQIIQALTLHSVFATTKPKKEISAAKVVAGVTGVGVLGYGLSLFLKSR